MDEILNSYHVRNLSKRVRIQGTITYYQPGSAMALQSGSESLWVMTTLQEPLRIGSKVDATGFPEVHDGFPGSSNAEVNQELGYRQAHCATTRNPAATDLQQERF